MPVDLDGAGNMADRKSKTSSSGFDDHQASAPMCADNQSAVTSRSGWAWKADGAGLGSAVSSSPTFGDLAQSKLLLLVRWAARISLPTVRRRTAHIAHEATAAQRLQADHIRRIAPAVDETNRPDRQGESTPATRSDSPLAAR